MDDARNDDTPAAATLAVTGTNTGYTAELAALDWFTYTVPSGERIDILAHIVGDDIEMHIYDDIAGTHEVDGIDTFAPYDLEYINNTPAPVQLWFSFQSGSCSTYEFDLSTSAPPVCATDDPFEDNDDVGGRSPITTGVHTGLVATATDSDYYTISVPAGEQLVATLTNMDDSWYSASIAVVETDDTVITNDTIDPYDVDWINTQATPQEAIIRVQATGADACIHYDLDIVTNTCSVTEDPYEPNDEFAMAMALPATGANDLWQSSGSMEDYFILGEVLDGQTITVDLTFLHDQGDIDVSLRDESGGFLATALTSTDNEQVVWLNDSGAPVTPVIRAYYIVTGNFNECVGQTYNLTYIIQ